MPARRPEFWSEEWAPEVTNDSQDTTLQVRFEALIDPPFTVAGLIIELRDDDGQRLGNVDMTANDAEALIEFMQAHLPRLREIEASL